MQIRGKKSVLTALARGEEVLVIVMGGGMSCVISLGVLAALVRADLHRFKAGIGVSGGACNLAALFSNPEKIESVLEVFEYLACGGFLRLRLGPLGWYLAFNLEELIQTLEGKRSHIGLPALDEANVASQPSPFWVVATDHRSGKGVFLDAKRDLFRKLRATMSVQGVCSPVDMEGRQVSDGQVGLKIGPAIRKVMARKVIVIMNRPPMENRGWWEQMLTPTVTRMALLTESRELREAAATMDFSFSDEVRRLEACKRVETLVIYPDFMEDMWPWTNNVSLLNLSFARARDFTERLVEDARAV